MFVLVSTKTNICSEAAVSESFVGYSVLAVNILLGFAEQEKKTQRASPFGSPENGDFAKTLNVAYPPKTGAQGESYPLRFRKKVSRCRVSCRRALPKQGLEESLNAVRFRKRVSRC